MNLCTSVGGYKICVNLPKNPLNMFPVIAIVGPSGAGKSTMMDEVVRRIPNKVDRIVSFTTRPQRNEADLLYYEFVDRAEVERRRAAGIVVQYVEFNGNYYGTDWPHIKKVLDHKLGILAVVEHGIQTYIDAGIPIIVVKIEPKGFVQPASRVAADALRAQIPIKIDKTIVNNFAEGGFKKAVDELVDYLQSIPTR